MSRDANQLSGPAHPPALAWDDGRLRAFASARRHSRHVRWLRIGLPAIAIGAIGLYFVTARMQFAIGDFQASVGHVEISRDALRMVNPRIEGVNRSNGTYVVTADFAEQKLDASSTVDLTGVKAELLDTSQDWSRLTAPKGTIDTKGERLSLFGGIDITASSGMTGRLSSASVDMKSQIINSQQPVTFEFLNGNVNAATMEVAMDKRIIIFRGNVRVQVRKQAVEEKLVKAQ